MESIKNCEEEVALVQDEESWEELEESTDAEKDPFGMVLAYHHVW